jgi:hypothetical protein
MELSKVGAEIDLKAIPTDYDIRYATTGGEDYELLLTVASDAFESLAEEFSPPPAQPLRQLVASPTQANFAGWRMATPQR